MADITSVVSIDEQEIDLTKYDQLTNAQKIRQMRKDLGLYMQIEYVKCDPNENTLTAWYNELIKQKRTASKAQHIVNKVSQLHYYVQNALGALDCGPNTELIVQHLELMKKWYYQLERTGMSLKNEYQCTINYLEWYRTASVNTNMDTLITNAIKTITDMKSTNQKQNPREVTVETTKAAANQDSGEIATAAGMLLDTEVNEKVADIESQFDRNSESAVTAAGIFLDPEVNAKVVEMESEFDLSKIGIAVNIDKERHVWFSRYLITALAMSYGSRSGTLIHHEFRNAISLDIGSRTLWQITVQNDKTKEPVTLLLGDRLYKLLKIYDRYFRYPAVKDKTMDTFFRMFCSTDPYKNILNQIFRCQIQNSLPVCSAACNQHMYVSCFIVLSGDTRCHKVICDTFNHSVQNTKGNYTHGLAAYRKATLHSILMQMRSANELDTETVEHLLHLQDVLVRDMYFVKDIVKHPVESLPYQSSLLEGIKSASVHLLCNYLLQAVAEGLNQSRTSVHSGLDLQPSRGLPQCSTSKISITESTSSSIEISPKEFYQRWIKEFPQDHNSKIPGYARLTQQGFEWGFPMSVIMPSGSSFHKKVDSHLRENLVKVQVDHILFYLKKRPASLQDLVIWIEEKFGINGKFPNVNKVARAVIAAWETPEKRQRLQGSSFLCISKQHHSLLAHKTHSQDWEGVEVKVNLPDRGSGLFTIKTFEKNEVVCDYNGELLVGKTQVEQIELNPSSDLSYFFKFRFQDRRHAVDALDSKFDNSFGRFANHSKCCQNVKPEVICIDNTPLIFFKAIRPLHPGEEILWDYGDKVAQDMFKDSCPSCRYKNDPKYMSSTTRKKLNFEVLVESHKPPSTASCFAASHSATATSDVATNAPAALEPYPLDVCDQHGKRNDCSVSKRKQKHSPSTSPTSKKNKNAE